MNMLRIGDTVVVKEDWGRKRIRVGKVLLIDFHVLIEYVNNVSIEWSWENKIDIFRTVVICAGVF
jgi:hypothetical protein